MTSCLRGKKMRILGIDPGLRLTGYGVIDYRALKPSLIDGGVIRLNEKTSVAHRLLELDTELNAILLEHKPDVYALVRATLRPLRPSAHPAILMGHALAESSCSVRRRAAACGSSSSPPIASSNPSPVTVTRANRRCSGRSQAVWNLKEPPDPPDVADALAVALCCGRALAIGKWKG